MWHALIDGRHRPEFFQVTFESAEDALRSFTMMLSTSSSVNRSNIFCLYRVRQISGVYPGNLIVCTAGCVWYITGRNETSTFRCVPGDNSLDRHKRAKIFKQGCDDNG